jgi:oxygen-dependent protoporphyrinogen oxidase
MKRIAVIGGGISGLSAAFHLVRLLPDAKITLFEKEDRLGGTIQTSQQDGFCVEHGPNGFLDSKASTLDLCRQAGFAERLILADEASKRRYIFMHNRMCPVPKSPLALLTSPILTMSGKIRVLKEPFIKPGPSTADETIFEFGKRRLGREFAERFLDPMATGIFAGDIRKLSLRACFPRIFELEQNYKSLIRALFKLMRKRKAKMSSPSEGPGKGTLTTHETGAQAIIQQTAEACSNDVEIRKHCTIQALIKDNPYTLRFKEANLEKEEVFDIIVFAVPAYALAGIFSKVSPAVSDLSSAIQYSPMAVVGLGFKKEMIKNKIDGYGFLIPALMKRRILGALFSSRIFVSRAPAGYELVRVLMGGARNPEMAGLPADKSELNDILKTDAKPDFAQCITHKQAIPHYEVGHLQKRLSIEETLKKDFPGIFLCGNGFFGVGMNDCTLRGQQAAQEVKAYLEST